jgi:hypothetical protein
MLAKEGLCLTGKVSSLYIFVSGLISACALAKSQIWASIPVCPRQCFGSESGSAFYGLLDPDLHCECGFGFKRGKITKSAPKKYEKLRQKTIKNMKISIFHAVIF